MSKGTYHLYLRGKTTMRPATKKECHDMAITPPWQVAVYGRDRHHIVGEFTRYKDLVAHAHALCVMLRWPKTRWMDIFDWNV